MESYTLTRTLQNGEDERDSFLRDVLDGLQRTPKSIPSKYFYDENGGRLFDMICGLDEYYLTRMEISIMQKYAGEIAATAGKDVLLVEFGSGSCIKTNLLISILTPLYAYVPVDISGSYLETAVQKLGSTYPLLKIHPLKTDYYNPIRLPDNLKHHSRIMAYFPGSTIGNFHPEEAVRFIAGVRNLIGRNGGFLIGIDLKKDPFLLHRAYNDTAGITSAFNKNVLVRINGELGANFRPDFFKHYAFYNPVPGRIEMHLLSLKDHSVTIDGTEIVFSKGESIHTENSYKYTSGEFAELAKRGGMRVERAWEDDNRLFSIRFLVPV